MPGAKLWHIPLTQVLRAVKSLTANKPTCSFEEVQAYLFETWKMYVRSTKYIVKGIDRYAYHSRSLLCSGERHLPFAMHPLGPSEAFISPRVRGSARSALGIEQVGKEDSFLVKETITATSFLTTVFRLTRRWACMLSPSNTLPLAGTQCCGKFSKMRTGRSASTLMRPSAEDHG